MTDKTPEGGQVISENRAKQGRVGNHTLIVLAISLVLVLAAFVTILSLQPHRAIDSTPQAAQQNAMQAAKGTS